MPPPTHLRWATSPRGGGTSGSDFRTYAQIRHELALRAADALHLAVAALGGHALATLDARLAEGAQAVGVRVVG